MGPLYNMYFLSRHNKKVLNSNKKEKKYTYNIQKCLQVAKILHLQFTKR